MLDDHKVPVTNLEKGQRLGLGDGIELETLLLEERGAVLWLSWENFSALLPIGNISITQMDPPSDVDVLLLPDNLQADDLPMEVVNQWFPSLILIPMEESDLPFQGQHEILSVLQDYPVVTTLDHALVRISTDGQHLWVTGD